jgi:hypothetical protein
MTKRLIKSDQSSVIEPAGVILENSFRIHPGKEKKWLYEAFADITKHVVATGLFVIVLACAIAAAICIENVETSKLITDRRELEVLHYTSLIMIFCGGAAVITTFVSMLVVTILRNIAWIYEEVSELFLKK